MRHDGCDAGSHPIAFDDRRVADPHAVDVGDRVERAGLIDAGRDPEVARTGLRLRKDPKGERKGGRKGREDGSLRRHARSAATCADS